MLCGLSERRSFNEKALGANALSELRPVVQQLQQQVVAWVRMPFVLAEAFGVFDSDVFASLGTPAATRVQVFVDSVLLAEPVALTGVAGQSFDLLFKLSCHINREINVMAIAVVI